MRRLAEMLAKTTSATAPTAILNFSGSHAQARRIMMAEMKAMAVPSSPRMKAIVPRLFAMLRSPLSQALSERAANRRARPPKRQLQVPRSVNMAMGKWEGGFSPRKLGG